LLVAHLEVQEHTTLLQILTILEAVEERVDYGIFLTKQSTLGQQQ
jgi:hypothetical protein